MILYVIINEFINLTNKDFSSIWQYWLFILESFYDVQDGLTADERSTKEPEEQESMQVNIFNFNPVSARNIFVFTWVNAKYVCDDMNRWQMPFAKGAWKEKLESQI